MACIALVGIAFPAATLESIPCFAVYREVEPLLLIRRRDTERREERDDL